MGSLKGLFAVGIVVDDVVFVVVVVVVVVAAVAGCQVWRCCAP